MLRPVWLGARLAPAVSPPVMVIVCSSSSQRLGISDAYGAVQILHIQQKTYNVFPRPRRGRKRAAAGCLLHNRRCSDRKGAEPPARMRPIGSKVLEEGQPQRNGISMFIVRTLDFRGTTHIVPAAFSPHLPTPGRSSKGAEARRAA